MSSEFVQKRRHCEQCRRPLSVCLCPYIHVLSSPVELIIWQDPTEARHPLSTAPLLHKSIAGSRLLVADCLQPQDIFAAGEQSTTALLYPFTHKPALAEDARIHIRQLLILDGTWRKVRRLLHLNPWLNDLPHIALTPQQPSGYAIRASQQRGGLSTIEAGVSALQWLDPLQDYQPVLRVLNRMVEIQKGFGHKG
ncbi:tRNA-uridine aminocarboxypropyltransferase [Thalassolituus sp. UBA2009]|uniref:tRNA-uridine aminocarboxypropyltransferase n=1 Tax=Thalassolituus sp. UBA2009 TaxID=1947658 RepID=UPI00257B2B4B|nr:tRNA-uridine aminocarboxypropyltransferase [Thalassolituus sp. UBA2009]